MKRALAFAVIVAILAPVAGMVAAACSAMPCCTAKELQISRTMPCCQPVMCADPTPGRQEKAPDVSPIAVAEIDLDERPEEIVPPTPEPEFQTASAPPRSTAVRLALIATLLI